MKSVYLFLLSIPVLAGALGPPFIGGLGASTIASASGACLDVDGDGYGVGPACSGPDADDFDSTVHTGAQGITKYGTLNLFLTHLGHASSKYWCLSPTGNNGTGTSSSNSATACGSPFLTWAGISGSVAAGDTLLLRNNWNGQITPPNGSSGSPFTIISYPGELAVFDATDGMSEGINILDRSWLVIDNVKFIHAACMSGGTNDSNYPTSTFQNNIIWHIEGTDCEWGFSAFNGLINFTLEYSVLHDNCAAGCQHGIYMGSRGIASDNVTVRHNITYHNFWLGFQWNGRCNNCHFDQNVAYDNGLSGIGLDMGLHDSFVRGNLLFNNGASGIILSNYRGACYDGMDNYAPPATNSVNYICPFDQINNLIENNTIYNTGKDRDGGSETGQAGIHIVNDTPDFRGDLGHNTYRNNVVAAYDTTDLGFGAPIIWFEDTSQNYLATSTFDHILGFATSGNTQLTILGKGTGGGFNKYTCSGATAVTTISNCSVADPKFVAASTSYYSTPQAFDLHLQATSPALYAGSPTGIPNNDLAGRVFADTNPSMGALEYQPWPQGWTRLTGAQINTGICPADGASGSVQNGGSAYPYQNNCPHVIRAWNSAMLRQTPGKPVQLCIWGGGHTDYGGNEMYCLNFNLPVPTMTRINNPSQITQTTYNTCPALLADGSANVPHTYAGIADHPGLDSMYKFHGGTYCGNGTGNHDTELFNLATLTWTAKDPVNCSVTCTVAVNSPIDPTTLSSQVDAYTVYAPWTGNMLTIVNGSSSATMEYNPTGSTQNGVLTNQYILRSASQPGLPDCFSPNCTTPNLTLDTNLQEILIMGAGVAYKVDVSVGGTFTYIDLTSHTSGCSAILNGDAPGLAYRPVDGLIYAYVSNGGSTLYSIAGLTKGAIVDTLTCTAISSFSGGPTSGSNNTGMFGRFTHDAATDTFPVVNDFAEDAFVFNPNAGGTPVCLITPTGVLGGTVGVSYSQTLTETNCGTSNFSISSGSLPTGLSGCSSGSGPTCTITGTPTTPGTYSFTVAFDTAANPLTVVVGSSGGSPTSVPSSNVLQQSGRLTH